MMTYDQGRAFLLRAKQHVDRQREALRMAELEYEMHEKWVAKEVAAHKRRHGIERAPTLRA